ncbi:lipoprotein [Novosphingobium silvae]|jgi:predicted small lipoprotein YifL
MRHGMKQGAMLILVATALAACGQRSPLALKPGQQLPPAPYGRADKPSTTELLTASPVAIPLRSVELRTRSEEREDDPFDLPPPEAPQPQ